jgi:hypothetical protein
MDRSKTSPRAGRLIFAACVAAAAILAVPGTSWAGSEAATSESSGGPVFKRGMWHFVRTLEMVVADKVRHTLSSQEMTRCVDPTEAMNATFSTGDVGTCRSSKPEKAANRYTFANRCDYMGPARTTITVISDAAYSEQNEIKAGDYSRVDLVIAKRIGDCAADSRKAAKRIEATSSEL